MGTHHNPASCSRTYQSHRRWGKCGNDYDKRWGKDRDGDNDNELSDMLEIPEKALVDDIRDDESEESVKVLLRYCGCTDETYGKGGSFDVTENTASYETSGDDNDLIENIDIVKAAEADAEDKDDDDVEVNETGTEDDNNGNLLPRPSGSGNIKIIKAAEAEDNDDADVNETGTEDDNNGNLLPRPSGSGNIKITKAAEAEDNDDADVNETETKDDSNVDLLPSPSGHIEIIKTAQDNDNADVNENGTRGDENGNLLQSGSHQADETEARDEVEKQDDEARDEVNESMDNSKNISCEGSSNDGIVDEEQQVINNELTSTDTQPYGTASISDPDDAPLEEEPDNDAPFDEDPYNDAPFDEEPKNYVPHDYDEEPINHFPIDEQPGENTPFDQHPNERTPGEHQPIPNKSEKKNKHAREYNIKCSNNVNSIHSVRAVEVDMTSSSRRRYPVISPPVRKIALSLHHVQNHPRRTINCAESRDPENAHHSALSTVSDRDDHNNKVVNITAECREEKKDPVPLAALKAPDPLSNLEEMDMDMLIKSTRAWLETEKAERKVRSETQKAQWKDIEILFKHQ